MLEHKAFFDKQTNTLTYLVWDKKSGAALIIDPVLDYDPAAGRISTRSADRVLDEVGELGLKLEWVLDTHAHADHLSAGDYIRQKTKAKLGIGQHIVDVQKTFRPFFLADDVTPDGRVFDQLFENGDSFALGDYNVQVLHTPGHTPACVSYLIGDRIFVGDTLFMPDYGTARADFPGGDAATLFLSIQKILALPDDTKILVGHDYLPKSRTEYAWETTVGEQKENNIHIGAGVTQEEYVLMREARDKTLKAPTLILPSLQVNIRSGALPPISRDGHHHLVIPLNRI